MASNTTIKGEYAALKFDQRSIEKGFVSSKPVFDCAYDRIIEKDGCFSRVQIKFVGAEKSSRSDGSSSVRMTRIGHKWQNASTYTEKEVDAIVAYIEAVDKFVWLKPEIFSGKTAISIRYQDAKNGQSKGCYKLCDYEW